MFVRKRVAVVTAVYAPVRGGMSTVATAEATALRAHHDITVFTLTNNTGAPEEPTVIRLRAWPRISLGGFVPQLVWRLWNFDTVYAHLPAYGFMLPLLVWKFLRRRRLVITVHMDPIGAGWRRLAFAIERPLLRAIIYSADVIRVSSDTLSASNLVRGVRNKQVIPFGVDIEWWHSSKAYGGRERERAFLFVGRLSRTHYFKGVDILLRAFARVEPPFQLWIVGDGDLRASYEHLAATLGIKSRVDFLGALSDEALRERYQRAFALVLPSTDRSETFGMVLLEAMACGCPVIASNLSGVDTVVANGVTGMLIPPSDEAALSRALRIVSERDTGNMEQMSRAARERACGYGGWNVIAARLAPLL